MLNFINWITSGFGSEVIEPITASRRSPQWADVRKGKLKASPKCAACQSVTNLEVHHVVPYHVSPEMELLEGNLISLCRECHFTFGHLKDWTSWNAAVRSDCSRFANQRAARP